MYVINIVINRDMFDKIIGCKKGFDKEDHEKDWTEMTPGAPRLDPVDLACSRQLSGMKQPQDHCCQLLLTA